MNSSKFLTVEQALAELNAGVPAGEQIARSTWQRWRARGKGPNVIRLPNGKLRIRRSDFESWLASLEDRVA
jgi:predicted site-specific integrase-resolvase